MAAGGAVGMAAGGAVGMAAEGAVGLAAGGVVGMAAGMVAHMGFSIGANFQPMRSVAFYVPVICAVLPVIHFVVVLALDLVV